MQFIITAWLIAIAVMDFRVRKVRNWMVLLGLAMGFALLFSHAQPFQTTLSSGLLGMLVAFVALLPLYALGWMGAGDVKFAAVMGLWLGCSPALLAVWVGGSLLAGLHGLAVLAWQRMHASGLGLWLCAHMPALAKTSSSEPLNLQFNARNRKRSIPYAGYMAVAAIGLQILQRQALL